MKHVKLFEGFRGDQTSFARREKAKNVMAVATPEQKIVLNDFQTGTEFLFLQMFPNTGSNGEITAKTIDHVLQLMVSSVEGDESQLETEHAKYARKKGWLDGFESLK